MNIYIYMYMYIYDFMIRDVTYVYTSNHICSWYIPVVVVCVVYICLVHIQRIWSSSRRCLVAFQHPDPGTFRAKSHSWFMDVGSLNFVQFHRFWMAKWDVLTHPHIPHIPHPNFCNLDHLIVCISIYIYIYIYIYICIYIYIQDILLHGFSSCPHGGEFPMPPGSLCSHPRRLVRSFPAGHGELHNFQPASSERMDAKNHAMPGVLYYIISSYCIDLYMICIIIPIIYHMLLLYIHLKYS